MTIPKKIPTPMAAFVAVLGLDDDPDRGPELLWPVLIVIVRIVAIAEVGPAVFGFGIPCIVSIIFYY